MDRFPERPQAENVFMYDTPPPYAGINSNQQQAHQFDARNRVNNVSHGYANPNDPSKVYVSAPYVCYIQINIFMFNFNSLKITLFKRMMLHRLTKIQRKKNK